MLIAPVFPALVEVMKPMCLLVRFEVGRGRTRRAEYVQAFKQHLQVDVKRRIDFFWVCICIFCGLLRMGLVWGVVSVFVEDVGEDVCGS